MNSHPKLFNSNHFSTEKFPEVIAFCDRVENSHIHNGKAESYGYELNGKQIYTLKKLVNQWELEESENNTIIRVSTGRNLGLVLMQGLRFSDTDKEKQEDRVNILFPVQVAEVEKALALMYYYGGYPGSFLQITPELALIIERFVDPNINFLTYSYVPITYLEWLREQLKNAEIIKQGSTRTLWVYKK
ncbi:MAG TPA: hypothetical protein VNW29_03525 [Candidatus Sulfotelmatobacter sp.]|jgi:hypothetical protein|nr:hypothetical protein [Candidatus Sulfotelmatobacter sp.]